MPGARTSRHPAAAPQPTFPAVCAQRSGKCRLRPFPELSVSAFRYRQPRITGMRGGCRWTWTSWSSTGPCSTTSETMHPDNGTSQRLMVKPTSGHSVHLCRELIMLEARRLTRVRVAQVRTPNSPRHACDTDQPYLRALNDGHEAANSVSYGRILAHWPLPALITDCDSVPSPAPRRSSDTRVIISAYLLRKIER